LVKKEYQNMKKRLVALALVSLVFASSCVNQSSGVVSTSGSEASLSASVSSSSSGDSGSSESSGASVSSSAGSSSSSSSHVSSSSSSGGSSPLPVGSYWEGLVADGSVYGNDFRQDLKDIMVKKGSSNGTNSYKALNAILSKSDTNGTGKVMAFYRNNEATSGWNKEHTWPNSRGAGENKGYAGTDPQVIRPTNSSDNSSRSNFMYAEREDPSAKATASTGWDPAAFGYEGARGEAARIILYAATRYYKVNLSGAGGSYHGNASGMELTNNLTDGSANGTMGKLSDLLKWNREYAVTSCERYRNDYLSGEIPGSGYDYCRNPFIDHPEWADYIWADDGVRKTPVSSVYVSLEKSTLSLAVGDSATVTASATGFHANDWAAVSSAPSVASSSVGSSGLVAIKALSSGSATITVTGQGDVSKSAAITVSVTDPMDRWNLVTNASSLVAGRKYLIGSSGAEGSAKFLSTSSVGTYYQGIADGEIGSGLSVAPTFDMEKLVLGGEGGSWTFKTSVRGDEGGYLACSGTDHYNLVTGADPSLYKTWSVSIASSGAATIKNVAIDSSYKRYMEYYAANSEFSTYSDETSVVYLFAKTA
jgi:endonuclease I